MSLRGGGGGSRSVEEGRREEGKNVEFWQSKS